MSKYLTFFHYQASTNETPSNEPAKEKTVKDMLIDSAILGGIVFFSTWTGKLDLENIMISLKATGLTFITQLAYYRGLKKNGAPANTA